MKSIAAFTSAPAARIALCASTRAASTNCGSFIVTSACIGVFVRSRRTTHTSRVGPSKISIDAGGALALPQRVEAAPIQRLARILFVVPRVARHHRRAFPDARRLVRSDGRAAELRHEKAAGRQRRIAHDFAVEPEPRSARQQNVLRIAAEFFLVISPRIAGTSRT